MDESLFKNPTSSSGGGDDADVEEEAEILEGMINNLSLEVEGLDLEFIKNQPDIISATVVHKHCEPKEEKKREDEEIVNGEKVDEDIKENVKLDAEIGVAKPMENTCAEQPVMEETNNNPIITTEACEVDVDADVIAKTMEHTAEAVAEPSPSGTGDTQAPQGLKPETIPSGSRRKSVRFSESIDFPHRYDSDDPPTHIIPDDYESSRQTELREIRLQKQYSLLLQDRMRAEQKLYDELHEYSPAKYTKIAIVVSLIAAAIIFIRYLTG